MNVHDSGNCDHADWGHDALDRRNVGRSVIANTVTVTTTVMTTVL